MLDELNVWASAVSNMSVLMAKFNMTKPFNCRNVLKNFVRLILNFLSTGRNLMVIRVSYAVFTFINETNTDPVKDSIIKNT